MTGEVPDAPRKRRRAGSIPAFSTGFEEDGNPLRSGRRETGSVSRGADLTETRETANPPVLGTGYTQFDSAVSDHACLAQSG